MTATIKAGDTALRLPIDGVLRTHVLGEPGPWRRPGSPITSRIAYAAAHVVPKATADSSPGAPADLDWDITLAYRHELWSYGLGVADAMDTAQRGMGLDWAATRELIARSGREAAAVRPTQPQSRGENQRQPCRHHCEARVSPAELAARVKRPRGR